MGIAIARDIPPRLAPFGVEVVLDIPNHTREAREDFLVQSKGGLDGIVELDGGVFERKPQQNPATKCVRIIEPATRTKYQ